jgi:hypothetical protein
MTLAVVIKIKDVFTSFQEEYQDKDQHRAMDIEITHGEVETEY